MGTGQGATASEPGLAATIAGALLLLGCALYLVIGPPGRGDGPGHAFPHTPPPSHPVTPTPTTTFSDLPAAPPLLTPDSALVAFRPETDDGASPARLTVAILARGAVRGLAPAGTEGTVHVAGPFPPGRYEVLVLATDYAPVRLGEALLAAGVRTDLGPARLARGTTVRGRVLEEGRPATSPLRVGVVTDRPEQRLLESYFGAAVGLGPDGRFEAAHLPPGPLRLVASTLDQEASAVLDLLLPDTGPKEVSAELHLRRGAIRGRLRRQGKACAGALVRGGTEGLQREARTDTNGAFELRGLVAGTLQVEARDRSGATSSLVRARVDLGPDVTRALELSLPVGDGWRGRLLRGEQPIAGATVTAFTAGDPAPGATAPTDGQGRFHLPGLAPGSYRVEVRLADGALRALEATLPPGGEADLGL